MAGRIAPTAANAMELFEAYAQEKLPKLGGYIASSSFQQASAYAKYEIVAGNNVRPCT